MAGIADIEAGKDEMGIQGPTGLTSTASKVPMRTCSRLRNWVKLRDAPRE